MSEELALRIDVRGKATMTIRLRHPRRDQLPRLQRELHQAALAWSAERDAPITVALTAKATLDGELRDLREYVYADDVVNGARLAQHLDGIVGAGRLHRHVVLSGTTAAGADLVGRAGVIDVVVGHLTDASVYLAAPRRYGKSSVLREVAARLRAQSRPTIHVDLSEARGVSWAIVHLASAAASAPGLVHTLEGVGLPVPASSGDEVEMTEWRYAVAAVVERAPMPFLRGLLRAFADARAVLLLDEFSIFVRHALQGDEEATLRSFLAAFAEARAQGVSMALCGSSGLAAYASFRGLPVLDDRVRRVDLRPLSRDDGARLAEELLYGLDLWPTSRVAAAVAAALGEPVPHFVHALARSVFDHRATEGTVDAADVDAAYRGYLLDASGNGAFRDYSLHRQAYPREYLAAARKVLALLAREVGGVDEAAVVSASGLDVERFVLLAACLDEDYDVGLVGDRYVMRCKPLRDRWRRREAWLVSDR